jgi:CheY-like chemotaxis protein
MSINILVVDDILGVAEGLAGKFYRFSEEKFNKSVTIEVLCNSDDAVRRISDQSKPQFDLLFTDIDLHGNGSPDKAGIAFARFARAKVPGVPIVGFSGKFADDDLSDEDRDVFDKWWPKGELRRHLPMLTQDTLERAILYHQNRQTLASPNQTLHTTKSIVTNPVISTHDSVLFVPKEKSEFIAEGYSEITIEPSDHLDGLVAPFAVWKKESEEGFELEVVGCGAIFSWGDSYEDAEDALMEIIMDLKQTLHEPNESFSSSLLNAKRFVENVTGSRNLEGAA